MHIGVAVLPKPPLNEQEKRAFAIAKCNNPNKLEVKDFETQSGCFKPNTFEKTFQGDPGKLFDFYRKSAIAAYIRSKRNDFPEFKLTNLDQLVYTYSPAVSEIIETVDRLTTYLKKKGSPILDNEKLLLVALPWLVMNNLKAAYFHRLRSGLTIYLSGYQMERFVDKSLDFVETDKVAIEAAPKDQHTISYDAVVDTIYVPKYLTQNLVSAKGVKLAFRSIPHEFVHAIQDQEKVTASLVDIEIIAEIVGYQCALYTVGKPFVQNYIHDELAGMEPLEKRLQSTAPAPLVDSFVILLKTILKETKKYYQHFLPAIIAEREIKTARANKKLRAQFSRSYAKYRLLHMLLMRMLQMALGIKTVYLAEGASGLSIVLNLQVYREKRNGLRVKSLAAIEVKHRLLIAEYLSIAHKNDKQKAVHFLKRVLMPAAIGKKAISEYRRLAKSQFDGLL